MVAIFPTTANRAGQNTRTFTTVFKCAYGKIQLMEVKVVFEEMQNYTNLCPNDITHFASATF